MDKAGAGSEYKASVANITKRSEKDEWLSVYGREPTPSLGWKQQLMYGVAEEIFSDIGDAIYPKLGAATFILIDTFKAALDDTCASKKFAKYQATFDELISIGGEFVYEVSVVDNAGSKGRPVLFEKGYYKVFVGAPSGKPNGELRVVPIFAYALPFDVK